MRTRKAPVKEVEIEAEESEEDTDMSDEDEAEEADSNEDAVPMDEEVSEQQDDDIDMDALVNKTLQKFSTSKFHSKSTVCSALHSRLISSGKLSAKKMTAVKGVIVEQSWKGGKSILQCCFQLFVSCFPVLLCRIDQRTRSALAQTAAFHNPTRSLLGYS